MNNLGIIPEHLAEGIAGLDARRDEGLDSGTSYMDFIIISTGFHHWFEIRFEAKSDRLF